MSAVASNLVRCPVCGKKHVVDAEHYDRIITECGARWFVLQPKRSGPLVMIPHPGFCLTRREMGTKEKAQP